MLPMRKASREVNDPKEISEILNRCLVLRIAFPDKEYPYIVPMNFGFSFEFGKYSLFVHCAKQGRKIDLIRQGIRTVGFETDRLLNVGKSDKPCGWTSFYESVIGEGTVSLVPEKEKKKGMDLIMRHYGFTGDIQYDPRSYELTEIIKIDVTDLSAKRHSE